jgi:PAS domain S-box-containing protein
MPDNTYWSSNISEWLAAIVESSDDAVVGKTLDGVIRSWNAGATRVFGYSASEAVGKPVLMLIPPHLHDEERTIVSRLSNGERVDHYQTVRQRKDGSLIDVSLSVSPIRDKAGNVCGAAKIARDVTETNRLRRAEQMLTEQLQQQAIELEQQIEESQSLTEELEQSNDELLRSAEAARQSQQMAEQASLSKSRFLATMSHELRTPLNAIAGYVDLLEMGVRGSLSEQQRSDLGRIKLNQRTLLRLIDDVLDFAKIESGRLEYHIGVFAIDELLGTLEAYIAPTLDAKGITYSFEPCGDVGKVRADRDKAEQVLVNLLSNAAKFTDRGRISVSCQARDGVVQVEVADTGRGIRADLLEAIFDPFVQGDQTLTRSVPGTGLGLSISRQLARAMGGDVVAMSEIGAGSIFTLVLPRA